MPKKILMPSLVLLSIFFCITGYWALNVTRTSDEVKPQPVATSTQYRDADYGFEVTLPLSWKGYSITKSAWKAYALDNSGSGTSDETGELLSIRSPLWSTSSPRQDIPIMIFTNTQWDLLTQDKIHIGAAPMNPSELGRNTKYVFALPARYNYAFLLGYEEVDAILQTKPLRGF